MKCEPCPSYDTNPDLSVQLFEQEKVTAVIDHPGQTFHQTPIDEASLEPPSEIPVDVTWNKLGKINSPIVPKTILKVDFKQGGFIQAGTAPFLRNTAYRLPLHHKPGTAIPSKKAPHRLPSLQSENTASEGAPKDAPLEFSYPPSLVERAKEMGELSRSVASINTRLT